MPLCRISDREGESLVVAVYGVLDHYKIKPNAKTAAWLNLVWAVRIIYAPKFLVLREMSKLKTAQQRPSGAMAAPIKPAGGGMTFG